MPSLAAGLVLLACSSGAQQPSLSPASAAEAVAMRILQFQSPDGAIAMDPVEPARNTRVVPYVGNYAAMGLIAAYTATKRTVLLQGALKWARWYEKHLNADGTTDDWAGPPGLWQSTGKRDSTDAYAATYLTLLNRIFRAHQDRQWLEARKPFVEKAVSAIRLTLQPRGLTTAKPDWPVMYTMDNVETAIGLRSAATIAQAAGWLPLQRQALRMAQAMEDGIASQLWDPSSATFLVGLQTDGARLRAGSEWYPSVMANLMAAAWLPRSQRTSELFQRLYRQYGSAIPIRGTTAEEASRLIWWGYAAGTYGTPELLNQIQSRLTALAAHVPAGCYPDALGHICVLLTLERAPQRESPHAAPGRETMGRRRSKTSASQPTAPISTRNHERMDAR
ncbi:MAG: hypothetical protein ACP5VE_02600 [Chthonomonadales bacterium]